MYKCSECNRVFTRPAELFNHMKWKRVKIDYSNDPKKCKNCGKDLEWKKRNNTYCGKRCANIGENNPQYGKKLSENQKRKISESLKGMFAGDKNPAKRPEVRKKISESKKRTLTGDENPAKRPEVRKKISEANKGRKHSEETKRKIGNANRGKKRTKEFRRGLSRNRIGKNSSNWKGGVTKLDLPLYDTYAYQLRPYEEVRRDPDDPQLLQVRCVYNECRRWYTPTRSSVVSRIASINGTLPGEHRLYCSNECKESCSIFKRSRWPKGSKIDHNREVQPELRRMVIERDGHACIKCKSTKQIICHHIEGIRWEPLQSADIDMCITVCKSCHNAIHRMPGCTPIEMRCEEENDIL